MDNNFEDLQYFLENTPIPSVKEVPLTYFKIWGNPHYENLWSNVYAFFFNPKAEHNLGELFAMTLTELINEKTGEKFVFNSSDIEVKTEVGTKKGGRIDILLFNEEEAIIIENKVYHTLNNDFDDYYESIEQDKKYGVILTLHKLNKEKINERFVGITHLELIERVIRNLSPYFSKANEKYLILLKDFQQNIINITMPINKEAVEFYWENFKRVEEIKTILGCFDEFIKEEVNKVTSKIKQINNSIGFYALGSGHSKEELMIGINVDKLLWANEKTFRFFIDVRGSLLAPDKIERFKRIDFTSEEKKLINTNFYTRKGSERDFTIQKKVEVDDIFNLSDIIVENIENSPILSIYNKIKAEFDI